MHEETGTFSTKCHRTSFGVIKSPNSRISRYTGWCLLGSAIPCSNARRNAKEKQPWHIASHVAQHRSSRPGLFIFFGSTEVSQSHVWSRCKAEHRVSAKAEIASNRNLVQPVDCRTRLELQGPTMDEAACSTGLKIRVSLS